jgi:hypothetical protein
MSQRPNFTVEEFTQGYRFIRLPMQWMGEAYTLGYLVTYVLTKAFDESYMRLYKIKHQVKFNTAFIKKSQNIAFKKASFEIFNEAELANDMLDADDKVSTYELVKEFGTDFEQVMDIVLELQTEANERGWIRL